MSFGAIATDYDRLRPSPPADAVRWLLPDRCDVAVDLAAGTGLLTRVISAQVGNAVRSSRTPGWPPCCGPTPLACT
jgi:hypothetical protein